MHRVRRYQLDESVFDSVTEESAYWIGFLMADGCVWHRNGTSYLNLHLSSVDEAHVVKFRDFLKSTHPITKMAGGAIGKYVSHENVQFTVASRQIVSALSRYGIVPKKSLIAKVSGLERNKHFWRGVIDGDGCISFKKQEGNIPVLTLVGSFALLDQFRIFVKQLEPDYSYKIKKPNSIYRFELVGSPAIRVINFLYANSNIFLSRKQTLLTQVNSWVAKEKGRKLTPKQREDIVVKYRLGATIEQLSDEYGINYGSVRALLIRRGARKGKQKHMERADAI